VVSGSDCGYMFMWDKKTEAIVLRKRADRKGTVSLIFTFKIIFLIIFLFLGQCIGRTSTYADPGI